MPLKRGEAESAPILVCAATATEAKAVRGGLEARSSLPRAFEVLATGVGADHCRAAVTRRLSQGPRPRLIVSTGFAGAASRSLRVRSWVTATEIVGSQVALTPILEKGAVRCRLEHVASLQIRSEPDAGSLPLIIDMESAILAELAMEFGIPLAVWRLITDTPEEPLPQFLRPWTAAAAATASTERARYTAQALAAVVAHPTSAIRLAALGMGWARHLREGWAASAEAVGSLALP